MPRPASEAGQFRRRVLSAVLRIPVGRAATYGDIARLAGRPRAWRAVGTIMRTCDVAGVPCHRVVAAGGRLGGYGGNETMKQALLAAEGVPVGNGRIRRWAEVRWPPAEAATVEVRTRPAGSQVKARAASKSARRQPALARRPARGR